MAFRDDLLSVLSGGLPALLDGDTQQPTTVEPERTPPEPTNRDREPFLMSVSSNQILLVTGAIVAVLAVAAIVTRN